MERLLIQSESGIVDATLIQRLSNIEIDLNVIQQQRDLQLKIFRQSTDPYLEYCAYLNELYGFDLGKEEVKNRRYTISRHFLDHVVELKPQVELLIQALKQQGMRLALTTTTSVYNIQRYQDNNQNINQKISFNDDFDIMLTRENVENIKPHPEMYLKALPHFDVQAKDCLIIEDSLIGVGSRQQCRH